MYQAYEQIAVASAVLDSTAFTIPANATHVELRANLNSIRYVMDNGAGPSPAENFGMTMLTADEPKTFLIEDLQRIRFIRGAGNPQLLVHYFGGLD